MHGNSPSSPADNRPVQQWKSRALAEAAGVIGRQIAAADIIQEAVRSYLERKRRLELETSAPDLLSLATLIKQESDVVRASSPDGNWEEEGALDLKGPKMEAAVRLWWDGLGFSIKQFVDSVEWRIVCRELCLSMLPAWEVQQLEEDHRYSLKDPNVSALKTVSWVSMDRLASATWSHGNRSRPQALFHLNFDAFFEAFVETLRRWSPWLAEGYLLTQGFCAKLLTQGFYFLKNRVVDEEWIVQSFNVSRFVNIVQMAKAQFGQTGIGVVTIGGRSMETMPLGMRTSLGLGPKRAATGIMAKGLEAFQQEPDVEAATVVRTMLLYQGNVDTMAGLDRYKKRAVQRVMSVALGRLSSTEEAEIRSLVALHVQAPSQPRPTTAMGMRQKRQNFVMQNIDRISSGRGNLRRPDIDLRMVAFPSLHARATSFNSGPTLREWGGGMKASVLEAASLMRENAVTRAALPPAGGGYRIRQDVWKHTPQRYAFTGPPVKAGRGRHQEREAVTRSVGRSSVMRFRNCSARAKEWKGSDRTLTWGGEDLMEKFSSVIAPTTQLPPSLTQSMSEPALGLRS